MPSQLLERSTEPGIVSVIFAPTSENYTLLSANTEQRFFEVVVLESLARPDEETYRRILDNLRRAVWNNPGVLSEYLRFYLNTSYTTATLTLPTDLPISAAETVPSRSFPFAAHLNLLASPEEGLYFDPDDVAER